MTKPAEAMGLRERVARKLADEAGEQWDAKDFTQTMNGEDPEEMRDYWLKHADAAIAEVKVAQMKDLSISRDSISRWWEEYDQK